jgi:hypothetical protein
MMRDSTHAVGILQPAKEEQKEEEEMSAYIKAEDAEKGKEESNEDAEEEEEDDESPFVMPENFKDMFLWAASLPWYAK